MYRIESLDHTADAGFIIHGDSRDDLVLGSLKALADLLGLEWGGDTARGSGLSGARKTITIEGADAEALVEALNEWLYLVQVKGFRPLRHRVNWRPGHLELECRGTVPEHPEQLRDEIKAVTYHTAEVLPPGSGGEGWKARWIADL